MLRSSLLALCAALHVCHAASPAPNITPAQSIASTGWQLVRSVPQGNVVVSPFSIWTALGMVHTGAAAGTASEIASALSAPNDSAFFAQHVSQLQQTFAQNTDARVQLHTANRLWVQPSFALKPAFTQTLEQQFHSPIGWVNFRQTPEDARLAINQWVAQQTENRIQDLMPANTINTSTTLVLTNAIYMKAPWSQPFSPNATQMQAFQLDAQHSTDVPFMHQKLEAMAGKLGSGEGSATVCELPYIGQQLKMVLYVPDHVHGLAAMLPQLAQASHKLRLQPVVLSLPKWKAQQAFNLNRSLQQLGIHQAFDARLANFSGMRAEKDVFLSHVIHQSFVEVTETGTEAAAATGAAMMMRTSAPMVEPKPLVVRADRPFAWAIVESRTGTPLFTGVVRDPRL